MSFTISIAAATTSGSTLTIPIAPPTVSEPIAVNLPRLGGKWKPGVALLTILLAAACGGGTATPSQADKKACVAALYKLDVRVWVLHQPIDLDPAAVACYWVSRSRLRAATMAGQAGYQERIRRLFGS